MNFFRAHIALPIKQAKYVLGHNLVAIMEAVTGVVPFQTGYAVVTELAFLKDILVDEFNKSFMKFLIMSSMQSFF